MRVTVIRGRVMPVFDDNGEARLTDDNYVWAANSLRYWQYYRLRFTAKGLRVVLLQRVRSVAPKVSKKGTG